LDIFATVSNGEGTVTEFRCSHGAFSPSFTSLFEGGLQLKGTTQQFLLFYEQSGEDMEMKFDLYHYENQLNSVLRDIESSSKISEGNKSTISSFYSNCITEGLTTARIAKVLFHLRRIAVILDKEFAEASKEDIARVVREIETNPSWSAATKHDYKVVLKKFYKWLGGTGEFPDKVKWVKANFRKNGHKLPEELLSEEDVRKLVDAAQHPRDKALIMVLYESGCRIGELLNLRVRNVLLDDLGAVLLVNGKTGQRRVRIIASAPLLAAWLDIHPFKEKLDSPVWLVVGTKNHNEMLRPWSAAMQLKKIAMRGGIKKRVNPHAFRHARATFLANNLTEAQMKEYFGWVQSSDMASVYVHLSGRDVDNAILKLHGLANDNEKKNESLKIKNCARCQEKNSPLSKFCCRCGSPLDMKTALELDQKRKEGDEVISMLVKDPRVQKIIVEKILEDSSFKEKLKQLSNADGMGI
jgi:integrase